MRNGSGVMSIPYSDFVNGTTADADQVDANNADLVAEITNSIAADGQTTPTANLPMGNYKLTGLGAGSAATDSANLGQIQAQAWKWCGTAGGTADALTLTVTPAITAYAAGQSFRFIAGASPNTGPATVAVSGLPAKDIQNNGSALAASDIAAGKMYEITYDGTQFQLNHVVANAGSSGDMNSSTYDPASVSEQLVGLTATQTLTNKTMDADNNTVSNIGAAEVKSDIITGQTNGTISASDKILFSDADDTDNLKEDTVQGILDLVTSGITQLSTQATTSGTSKDFTIPSGAKRCVVKWEGVSNSSNGFSYQVQLGDSGGIETTNYEGTNTVNGSTRNLNSSSFLFIASGAVAILEGMMILELQDSSSNTWSAIGRAARSDTAEDAECCGSKSLSAELTTIRFSTTGGAFDAGSVSVSWE